MWWGTRTQGCRGWCVCLLDQGLRVMSLHKTQGVCVFCVLCVVCMRLRACMLTTTPIDHHAYSCPQTPPLHIPQFPSYSTPAPSGDQEIPLVMMNVDESASTMYPLNLQRANLTADAVDPVWSGVHTCHTSTPTLYTCHTSTPHTHLVPPLLYHTKHPP